MKKTYNILFLLVFFTQAAWAATFNERITYEGRELVKTFEAGAMAEYISPKETLDNWSEMFAVRVHLDSSPEEALGHLEKNLEALRSSGRDSYARVIESYSNSEERIHFIVITLSEDNIFEYNVFRYIGIEEGKVISFQLAKRHYRPMEFTEEEANKVVDWTMKQIEGSKEDVLFLFDEDLPSQIFGS